jgi:hypothetical protein
MFEELICIVSYKHEIHAAMISILNIFKPKTLTSCKTRYLKIPNMLIQQLKRFCQIDVLFHKF